MPWSWSHCAVRAAALFMILGVFAAPLRAQPRFVITGVVRDPTHGVVSRAEVQILGPQQRIVAAAITDAGGHFRLAVDAPCAYLVVVRATGFSETRTALDVPLPAARDLELSTGPAAIREDVSVTATIDRAEATTDLAQPVNVISADEIQQRVKTVVAQVASEETGLRVQRTSPTMAGIFVRGLTGNKVNVFVDGVRYSTGAQRGGVGAFFDLIEPTTLDAVEILRGPNSAQYDSDALGGSI